MISEQNSCGLIWPRQFKNSEIVMVTIFIVCHCISLGAATKLIFINSSNERTAMDLDLYRSELMLADGVSVRLSGAKGVCVLCTAGTLWLTVEGEAGDIFLRAGEMYKVRGHGLALLEGIAGDARVSFRKDAHSWWMLTGWLLRRFGSVMRVPSSTSCPRPSVA